MARLLRALDRGLANSRIGIVQVTPALLRQLPASLTSRRSVGSISRSTAITSGPPSRLIRIFLDRLPIGGVSGVVLLSPFGTLPPLPELPPSRPGEVADFDPLDRY